MVRAGRLTIVRSGGGAKKTMTTRDQDLVENGGEVVAGSQRDLKEILSEIVNVDLRGR